MYSPSDAPALEATTCFFDGCSRNALPHSLKCKQHRRKGMCARTGCTKQVYQSMVCIGHGGRRRDCAVPGCNKDVRVSGYCHHHAKEFPAIKCRHDGCSSMARGRPHCLRHTNSNEHSEHLQGASVPLPAQGSSSEFFEVFFVAAVPWSQDDLRPTSVDCYEPSMVFEPLMCHGDAAIFCDLFSLIDANDALDCFGYVGGSIYFDSSTPF